MCSLPTPNSLKEKGLKKQQFREFSNFSCQNGALDPPSMRSKIVEAKSNNSASKLIVCSVCVYDCVTCFHFKLHIFAFQVPSVCPLRTHQ